MSWAFKCKLLSSYMWVSDHCNFSLSATFAFLTCLVGHQLRMTYIVLIICTDFTESVHRQTSTKYPVLFLTTSITLEQRSFFNRIHNNEDTDLRLYIWFKPCQWFWVIPPIPNKASEEKDCYQANMDVNNDRLYLWEGNAVNMVVRLQKYPQLGTVTENF